MKVVILYHPKSDHARKVEDFARDMSRQYDRIAELVSLETREGADMARLYDVVQYPVIMAVANDGHLLKAWQGPILPLMDEVIYYAPDRLQAEGI